MHAQLGHTAGHLVLVTVADRIRRAVRPSDRLTRFGGDAFVVECADVDSDEEATVIADRIIAAVQEPIRLDVAELRVGASIGIARAALLAAKAAGRASHACGAARSDSSPVRVDATVELSG